MSRIESILIILIAGAVLIISLIKTSEQCNTEKTYVLNCDTTKVSNNKTVVSCDTITVNNIQ
jgi:hypothetical protein